MLMNKFCVLIILSLITGLVISSDSSCDNSGEGNCPKKRMKRYLGFKQGAKTFFRVNVKDNVLKVNQIWAHAYGFRQNFDIPYPLPKQYKVRRRDVHESLEVMLNHHGFDGRACVLRAFCDASKMVTPRSGIFLKLFRMIFSHPSENPYTNNSIPKGDEDLYPYLKSDDCYELEKHCPISLSDMSPYTDV